MAANENKAAVLPSKSVYPIDFTLWNKNKYPVLAMNDTEVSEEMVLTITNKSVRTRRLKSANKNAYHFTLTFLAGTLLLENKLLFIQTLKDWELIAEKLSDNKVVFRCRY